MPAKVTRKTPISFWTAQIAEETELERNERDKNKQPRKQPTVKNNKSPAGFEETQRSITDIKIPQIQWSSIEQN